ncbi:MAG: alpha/beta hydrolase [Gemmatimonadaceae bacterium]
MILLPFTFCVVFAFGELSAQATAWQPPPGHTQVPIWPGTAPDARELSKSETATTRMNDHLVAGRPWTYIENVSRPTMTVYSPKGKNTGAAVIVFPGGGYQILAIDLEGTEACDWLTSKGITCILLKYRVPNSGPSWDQLCGCDRNTKSSRPLEDAQRTIGLVRFHAAEWHIDPHKIGVLGFSAGGHMVAATSTHFERRLYPVVDAADKVNCRPDFAVAIYPGHLSLAPNSIALNPDIRSHISRQTPPTFLLQNEDDRVDRVEDALSYYVGLKRAGVPVEMHLYGQGGHAFGLRRTTFPATMWPQLVETWLGAIGMIPK